MPDGLSPKLQAQVAAFLDEWKHEVANTGGDVEKALQRIQRRKSDPIHGQTRLPWWPEGLHQDARGYYRHIGPELDLDTFEEYSVAVGRNKLSEQR